MIENYKNDDSVNKRTFSYSEDDDRSVLEWLNQGISKQPRHHTDSSDDSTKEPSADTRISEAKRKLEEWRRKQSAIHNNLNIQVVTQSMSQEDEEDSSAEAPVGKVKPWNNIPFSIKTKVTATAQLGLRYMIQNHKKTHTKS